MPAPRLVSSPGAGFVMRPVERGHDSLASLLRRFPDAHVSNRVLFLATMAHGGVATPDPAPLALLLGVDGGKPAVVYPRAVLDAVEAIATAHEWDALREYFTAVRSMPDVLEPWARRKRD